MFHNKTIFITWWTWSWGQSLTRSILQTYNVKKIIIFSRNEDKQVAMKRNFNSDKIHFILWDIRDKELLLKVTKNTDYVIHLAALKHIPKCEENNSEAVWINILWTQNIIDVAIINKVKKVIYISTDKAVDPHNIYGNTKAIGEKMTINANNYIYNDGTIFYALRIGNILGSNGSVIRIFYEQIKAKKTITVTDFDMRRFYVSFEEVVEFIFYTFRVANGWETFVLKWDVLSLKDIIDILLDLYWDWSEEIKEIGIREGEKRDESLISSHEVEKTFILDNKIFLIDSFLKNSENLKKVDFDTYSTKTQREKDIKSVRKKIDILIKNLYG